MSAMRRLALTLFLLLAGLLPASAQMMLLGVGTPPSAGGGCSQATAFLARVTTTNTTAYTTMICGMVTDGTWAKFDALYIFATDSAANALTNLISSSYPLTAVSSPTFTAASGYVSNGTSSYITSTLNYSTATNYTQNAGALLAWATGGATNDNGCVVGVVGGAFSDYLQPFNFGSVAAGSVNGATAASKTVANATGLVSISRTSSANVDVYKNGSTLGSTASASATRNNNTMTILACAAASSFYAENVGMAGVAGSLSSTDQSNIYSRIHTFLHTINASLYP